MDTHSFFSNKESFEALSARIRYLGIFKKDTWPEYIALLAKIYQAIEARGSKLPYSDALELVERFYLEKNLANPEQKNFSVITLFATELGVIKELFEADGRYIDTSRDGKQLLHWLEELERNRPQFTGTSAENMMIALQQLINDPKELTQDEAVRKHKELIQKLEADIKVIRTEGVHASTLLHAGVSAEELYQRADEEAARILIAAEDVKAAIESARRELTERYLDVGFSAGDAIEFIADYYQTLQKKPEFLSYMRAKEKLSYVEGLGALQKGKGITELIYELQSRKIVPTHTFARSSLHRFSEHFQNTLRSIEEKLKEQLYLLKVQVQYVIGGNSRRVREDLMSLHGLLLKNKEAALDCLSLNTLEIPLPLPFELGKLEFNPLERNQELQMEVIVSNGLGGDDSDFALLEAIRKSEEATIEKILRKLQSELDRNRSVKLSQYELTFGLSEYYVLSQIDFFSQSIASESVGITDLRIKTPYHSVVTLKNVADYQFHFTKSRNMS